MAQIKEYTNTKNVSPGPEESTAYSLERYGRVNQESIEKGASGLSTAADVVATHEAKNDVADVASAHSALQANLFERYETIRNDPNAAPEALHNFITDDVLSASNELQEKARTSAGYTHAQDLSAQMTYDFTRIAAADQVTQDQERHTAAINKAATVGANIANVHPDLMDAQITTAAHTVQALIPAAQQPKAMEQVTNWIADSAIRGRMAQIQRADPLTVTPDQIAATQKFIQDAQGKASREAFAQVNDDFTNWQNGLAAKQETLRNAQEVHARQQEKLKAQTQGAQIFHDYVHVDTDGHPYVNPEGMVAALQITDGETQRAVFNDLKGIQAARDAFDNREVNAKATTNEQVYQSLFRGFQTGQKDLSDLVAADHSGQLSKEDSAGLTKLYSAQKELQRDGFTPATNRVLGILDQEAKVAFNLTGGDASIEDQRKYTDFNLILSSRMLAAKRQGVDMEQWVSNNMDMIRGIMQSMNGGPNGPPAGTGLQRYQNLINKNNHETGQPPAASKVPPKITSANDPAYAALKKGDQYMRPDGKVYVKQ
jgi:hypothetical protein